VALAISRPVRSNARVHWTRCRLPFRQPGRDDKPCGPLIPRLPDQIEPCDLVPQACAFESSACACWPAGQPRPPPPRPPTEQISTDVRRPRKQRGRPLGRPYRARRLGRPGPELTVVRQRVAYHCRRAEAQHPARRLIRGAGRRDPGATLESSVEPHGARRQSVVAGAPRRRPRCRGRCDWRGRTPSILP
jgi:hypothetical protein